MTKLLETIRFDGADAPLLSLHQERMELSLVALFGADTPLLHQLRTAGLDTLLRPYIEGKTDVAVYKVRLVYDASAILEVTIAPYEYRTIRELQPMHWSEQYNYQYKFWDRTPFEEAIKELEADILPLFIRNGRELADTTYTNIVLELGEGLYTPSASLLKGVQQTNLIRKGIIRMSPLSWSDLERAKSVYLINAMIPLGDLRVY